MRSSAMLMLCLIFFSADLRAEKKIMLYDVGFLKGVPVPDTMKLIPRRVYGRFDEKKKQWFFEITNDRGEFPSPSELLRADTVLNGSFFGQSPKKNYLFTRDGKWAPTKLNEVHYLWVEDKPEYIKIIGFRDPASTTPKYSRKIQARDLIANVLPIPLQETFTHRYQYQGTENRWVGWKKGDPLLPNRVTFVYVEALRGWHYALTDFAGKLPDPLELLQPGTVVAGPKFGYVQTRSFLLSADQKWTETVVPEYHDILVLSKPQIEKLVTFASSRLLR